MNTVVLGTVLKFLLNQKMKERRLKEADFFLMVKEDNCPHKSPSWYNVEDKTLPSGSLFKGT